MAKIAKFHAINYIFTNHRRVAFHNREFKKLDRYRGRNLIIIPYFLKKGIKSKIGKCEIGKRPFT